MTGALIEQWNFDADVDPTPATFNAANNGAVNDVTFVDNGPTLPQPVDGLLRDGETGVTRNSYVLPDVDGSSVYNGMKTWVGKLYQQSGDVLVTPRKPRK